VSCGHETAKVWEWHGFEEKSPESKLRLSFADGQPSGLTRPAHSMNSDVLRQQGLRGSWHCTLLPSAKPRQQACHVAVEIGIVANLSAVAPSETLDALRQLFL